MRVPLSEADRNGEVVVARRVPVGLTPSGGGKTKPPGLTEAGMAWATMILQKAAKTVRKPLKLKPNIRLRH
jgi:hypothetical protein